MSEELKRKIESREAGIAVLGMGSVGLPLALAFERAGFRVLGFDIDNERVTFLEMYDVNIHYL